MLSALFMYSLIHEGTNLYVPCRCWRGKWRHPPSPWRPRRGFFFFYCNSVMKLDFVRVVIALMSVVWRPGGQRNACSAFCLPPWLTACHPHSVTSPGKQKNLWKSPRSLRPGLPSATITNLIYCLVLWQQAETDGKNEEVEESRRKMGRVGR